MRKHKRKVMDKYIIHLFSSYELYDILISYKFLKLNGQTLLSRQSHSSVKNVHYYTLLINLHMPITMITMPLHISGLGMTAILGGCIFLFED